MSIIIVGIFPLLKGWLDSPQPPQVAGVTNELGNILPKASGFLGQLAKPTDGVQPCSSGNQRRTDEPFQSLQALEKRSLLSGVFKTVFSLVTCVIDTTNKIRDGVNQGTTGIVKDLQDRLKPMVDALNEIGPDEPEPSASDSDQTSSI